MYFPWNWEFGTTLSKLRNFRGGLNPQTTPIGTPLLETSTKFCVLTSTDTDIGYFWLLNIFKVTGSDIVVTN
jgi:hypothetical protein